MLAGVGGGGPDGAPRPATATDGADPLAVTDIGDGGPFGPLEALEGAPRGEYVRDFIRVAGCHRSGGSPPSADWRRRSG